MQQELTALQLQFNAMTDTIPEQRNAFRRSINSFAMRDGETEESKVFATVGKGFCVWLLYKYTELLISHENVLFVLLLFLIFPELVKKLINVWADQRTGMRGSYTEHTEDRSVSTTTTKIPVKVDDGGSTKEP